MWCTRWFIPLLLLPLPTAPPYFLFLYLFSLTLHARPCFYCIMLLTALFISSCYWQPVTTSSYLSSPIPVSVVLSQPWPESLQAQNSSLQGLSLNETFVTTFAEALSLPLPALSFSADLPTLPTSLLPEFPSSFFEKHPGISLEPASESSPPQLRLDSSPDSAIMQELRKMDTPEVMRLQDRCWCDISGSSGGHGYGHGYSTAVFEKTGEKDKQKRGLWDVFDVAEWELASVARAREEMMREKREILRKIERDWREAVKVATHDESEEVTTAVEVATQDGDSVNTDEMEHNSQGAAVPGKKRRGGLFQTLSPLFSRNRSKENNTTSRTPILSDSPSHETKNIEQTESGQISQPPQSTSDSSHNSTELPNSQSTSLPLLRREYDLRPFGFAIILDFSWPSSSRTFS